MSKKSTSKKILVIPDAHARHQQSDVRFEALGNFIAEKQPDAIVCIGDWSDVESLCNQDRGQRGAEGRRYQDDMHASRHALAIAMRGAKKGYRNRPLPPFHITLGNHEQRIIQATKTNPELYGKLAIADLGFEEAGWQVHPFLTPLLLEGICFQHYFTSGILGKPIGGVNHARTLLLKNYQSSVCGHSHGRDMWEDVRADGKRLLGLVVGCYTDDTFNYTTEQRRWWAGLVILHEAHDGQFEPAFYSLAYIQKNYL